MDIRNYLTNYQEDKSIKNIYFQLDWSGKYPKYHQMFLLEKPNKNYQYIKTTKIKDKNTYITLHLLGNLETVDNNSDKPFDDLNEIPKNIDYIEFSNISMLKSIIQKSIRRKNSKIAVLASYHLMRLNLNEFLRRIIIIAIEDSCLHQSIVILLWFMISNDNKLICKKHIRYFLGIVYYLSKSNNYDRMVKTNTNTLQLDLENLFNYKSFQKNILITLWLRRKYGGMKGDMIMIDNVLLSWNFHIQEMENKNRLIEKIKFIKINGYLNLDSIPIYSVDFHCYPNIIKKIRLKFPELSLDQIKKLIWNNNSKINYRIRYQLGKDTTWNNINKYYYTLIKNYIYSCY